MDASLPLAVQQGQAGTTFILLYPGGGSWCDGLPTSYRDWVCSQLTFATGIYAGVVIVCPDNNMAACIHEMAHASHYALASHPGEDLTEYHTITRRFNEPDVQTLWSGYALENDGEFFAEMTAAYFCVPTEATSPVLTCADELQAYDPDTYDVIHAIYRGSTDLRTFAKRMR